VGLLGNVKRLGFHSAQGINKGMLLGGISSVETYQKEGIKTRASEYLRINVNEFSKDEVVAATS